MVLFSTVKIKMDWGSKVRWIINALGLTIRGNLLASLLISRPEPTSETHRLLVLHNTNLSEVIKTYTVLFFRVFNCHFHVNRTQLSFNVIRFYQIVLRFSKFIIILLTVTELCYLFNDCGVACTINCVQDFI